MIHALVHLHKPVPILLCQINNVLGHVVNGHGQHVVVQRNHAGFVDPFKVEEPIDRFVRVLERGITLRDLEIERIKSVHDHMVPQFPENPSNAIIRPSSTIRRSHERRVNANVFLERLGDLLHLVDDSGLVEVGEGGVGPGVGADVVAFRDGAAEDVDVVGDVAFVVSVLRVERNEASKTRQERDGRRGELRKLNRVRKS